MPLSDMRYISSPAIRAHEVLMEPCPRAERQNMSAAPHHSTQIIFLLVTKSAILLNRSQT